MTGVAIAQTQADLEQILAEGDFERVLGGLEQALELLDGGALTLDQTVAIYSIGVGLSRKAEALLKAAELQVAELDMIVDIPDI